MNRGYWLKCSLLVVNLLITGARTVVDPAETTEIEIELGKKSFRSTCYQGTAGKLFRKDSRTLFESYDSLSRKKRKKFKKTRKRKFKKAQRRFKKLSRQGEDACSGSSETPETPTGGGGGSSEQSYFDAFGNVTQLGRTVFEIPDGLSANAFVGQSVYQRSCVGCHEKRSRPTFSQLRQTISQAPMFYDESNLSNQDLADLVSYLNIHRSPLRE